MSASTATIDAPARPPGRSYEELLRAAGAEQDQDGRWYRWVPASTQQRPVYDDEGALASYEYDEAVRWVAYNPNPSAALEMARTGLDNQELIGQVDAFIPGLGWVRNGVKPEVEHSDQIADPNGTAQQPRRVKQREPAPDEVAALEATAIRPLVKAAQRAQAKGV
jgi:hypothetical protein